MKEYPILFSAPMVRAILEGRKTMTRRIVKHRDPTVLSETNAICSDGLNWIFWVGAKNPRAKQEYDELTKRLYAPGDGIKCPYGKPSDRLLVRETFYAFGYWEANWSAEKGKYEFSFVDLTVEAGFQYRYAENPPEKIVTGYDAEGWFKRPSIHMPRAASRILLEVVDVRVEQLQDISEADAIAEGVEEGCFNGYYVDYLDRDYQFDNAVESFRSLWQSINGPESWKQNPWVWVVEFKRINQ